MIALLATLFRYRQFIRFVVSRRRSGTIYRTIVGRGWLLINPLAHMLIYYFLIVIVFDRGGMAGVHPFVMITTGIVHYLMLQQTLTGSCQAILGNESLLMQVSIEPLVFTAATFYENLQNFVVTLVLFALFYVWLGPVPSWTLAWYPVILAMLVLLAWSWSVVLSSLAVFFRDIIPLISIVLRLLMYLSPVVYMTVFIPEDYGGMPLRTIYLYNPVACLFALLQWSLLGGDLPPVGSILTLTVFLAVSFIGAHVLYRRVRIYFTKAF